MKLKVLYFLIFSLNLCFAISEEEISIRNRLNIPLDAKNVLFIGQSSHMDWDWLKTFPGYYYETVENILDRGFTLVKENYNKSSSYYFSVAEVGFYEKFIRENLELLPTLKNMSDKFKTIGGGIVSPDNLLPHGEAFIRNYLVGKEILTEFGLPMSTVLWIPDDFGHDPQLPVTVKSMGLKSISFARAPGGFQSSRPIDGSPPITEILNKQGTDFFWKARDGSKVFTHYMQRHYNQGDYLDKTNDQNISNCTQRLNSRKGILMTEIKKILEVEFVSKRSPYMFVPISDDFSLPKTCLLEYIRFWNEEIKSDTFLVSATFEEFTEIMLAYHNSDKGPIRTTTLHAIPYWTGYYTSKPLLKLSHESTTRNLLAGEIFGVIAGFDKYQVDLLRKGWRLLVPTTHHDFITGTALDSVYFQEQVKYAQAYELYGNEAIKSSISKIMNKLYYNHTENSIGIAIFNQLGFKTFGITEIDVEDGFNSVVDGDKNLPIQKISSNKYLIRVENLPPVGYGIYTLSTRIPSKSDEYVGIDVTDNHIILKNNYIRVKISKKTNNVISIYDIENDYETLDGESVKIHNFHDKGNIYRYGNEMRRCAFFDRQLKVNMSKYEIIENGPLRVLVRTFTQLENSNRVYIRDYSLYLGESQLRVSIHGGADRDSSIFLSFNFKEYKSVKYGTPYHYDTFLLIKYWEGLNFLSIHNYLALLDENNEPLVGLFQSSIRGWAIENSTVYASLYRNNPRGCEGYGADAKDDEEYTYTFSIHTKRSLTNSNLLQRSLSSTNQPVAQVIKKRGESSKSMSFIHFEENESSPIITAMKFGSFNPNTVIIRFYSEVEENKTITSKLISIKPIMKIMPMTSLEDPLDDDSLKIQKINENEYLITQKYAIGTLEITFA